MNILAIETSCDETAVSIVEVTGQKTEPVFTVQGNALLSQIDMHRQYGGVFPTVAKREHAKNITPLLVEALTQAGMFVSKETNYTDDLWQEVAGITSREDDLYPALRTAFEHIERPAIDAIAVTAGPGLEPALWVGISCAKALGTLWSIPVIPTNHMEGHITSVLVKSDDTRTVTFPALALLISGGHTELVKIDGWGQYTVIGSTRDDAVGEAFDKVARLLGLPYPGGPEISKLATYARDNNLPEITTLPRPMIHSDDFDFSFSGLKTAVLYFLRDNKIDETGKASLAREFENAVTDVLVSKTKKALDETGAMTLIVAGGVIANTHIRTALQKLETEYHGLSVKLPTREMSTDNALMIATAGYMHILRAGTSHAMDFRANGNMTLGHES